ncbi:MAG: hypothetical protein ABSF83_13275 [Nitrososphaerales archaeon]|jgi:hypothetical protein
MKRGFFIFVLKNIGAEPGLEVTTRIGGRIVGPDGRTTINDLNVFRGIAFFAPGREFRVLVGYAGAYFAAEQPARFTAAISYSDDQGARYAETITHDLAIYRDMPHSVDEP